MLSPIIDRIAGQFAGRVKVGKVNVLDSPDLTNRYGIEAVPQVFLFQGGDQIVDQVLGVVPEKDLADMLTRTVGN